MGDIGRRTHDAQSTSTRTSRAGPTGCRSFRRRPKRVEAFVAASGRKADELIAMLPPRKGRATVEVIAINAIMAGCRPEYMPVLIAADRRRDRLRRYPLELMQVTTNPMTPFLLVNGPVRQKLEINYGTGCLGPGWRANATIGRALRLVLINAGGALARHLFEDELRLAAALLLHLRRERGRESVDAVPRRSRLQARRQHGDRVQGVELLQHLRRRRRRPRRDPASDCDQHAADVRRRRRRACCCSASITRDRCTKPGSPSATSSSVCGNSRGCRSATSPKRLPRLSARRGAAMRPPSGARRHPDEIYVAVAGGPGPQNVYIGAGMPQTRLIRGI